MQDTTMTNGSPPLSAVAMNGQSPALVRRLRLQQNGFRNW